MKKWYIAGGLVAGLGVIALVASLLTGGSSPRGWIAKNYTRTATDTYRASGAPTKVASDITRKFRPSERADDPAGVFLRYSNLVVAVLPDGVMGSRITVDDADRGYRRYYNYVGNRWAAPGRGSDFRGGGPGEGK
ncbi:DUF4247 domain-containing protein [Actinomadura sp. HBU206391]|uniref:DUF4247 domain-containing protein n=1 Tax=Actinomadura sp. HBU206391 TaxID=2731692 RepID=UPI0016508C05|nr:DUF4247 domain-containing protein [Actinomadura sp. HBU206391]MBC6457806.1 DUF4247 domain-containing protein [Actinomadura sp. HBU206391]